MSKKYKIEWAPIAISDFDVILDYIIENDSFNAALHVQKKLIKKIETLTLLPEKHRIPHELINRGIFSIRELVAAPYSIFFRIERDFVRILGVLDRRRDLEELLFQRTFLH